MSEATGRGIEFFVAKTLTAVESSDEEWLLFVEKVTPKAAVRIGRGQRNGEALFNAIWDVSPTVGERFRGSTLDPFNNDDRIPEFVQALFDFWLEYLL